MIIMGGGDAFNNSSNNDVPSRVCSDDLEDCIIAYIDILGTTDILCSDDNERVATFIHNVSEMYDGLMDDGFNIRIFSDNILFFDGYSEEGLDRLIDIACKTQYYFLIKYGLLTRGAIVRGSLFYNDVFVLGKGLVEAYDMESNVAKNPLVMISDDLPHDNPLITVMDGVHLVNYMDYTYDVENDCPNSDDLLKHKETILNLYENNLKQPDSKKKESIKSKHTWVIRYHNDYCRRNDVDDSLMIDEGNILAGSMGE